MAAKIREHRVNGVSPPNAERRRIRREQEAALAGRWTIARLWEAYKANKPDLKGIVTDEKRYKNYLQMADARTSGTATERIYSLVKVMGEDEAFKFQKAMNANVQMYTKSGAGGAMPIATGQCASGIFYIVDALDIQQQGYPVTITYPEDGVSFGIEATGVVKGGKNNAEAKKFVDWATSKKFAEFIVANKINYVPTRNDVKTRNPNIGITKIKTANLLPALLFVPLMTWAFSFLPL